MVAVVGWLSGDKWSLSDHHSDAIMNTMASQITSLATVNSIVYSDADQIKHQSSVSLAFVRGIHRWPVNSTHKWPVTRKMFPFADVIMYMKNVNHLPLCGDKWMTENANAVPYINSRHWWWRPEGHFSLSVHTLSFMNGNLPCAGHYRPTSLQAW